jgi:hypothetical protein
VDLLVHLHYFLNPILGNTFTHNRAMEICLSIVPRFCETFLNLLKSRGMMINIPKGDILVFSFVIAIIHYYYQHDVKFKVYFSQNH